MNLNDHLVFDEDDPVGDERDKDSDDAAESPQLKVRHCCQQSSIIILFLKTLEFKI